MILPIAILKIESTRATAKGIIMNLEELKKLADEWANNPACHDKFRKDPITYMRKRGFQVDGEDKLRFEQLGKLSDNEIEDRINKGTC